MVGKCTIWIMCDEDHFTISLISLACARWCIPDRAVNRPRPRSFARIDIIVEVEVKGNRGRTG